MTDKVPLEKDTSNTEARIEELEGMIRARTDADGKPLPGFKNNVPLVRAELAKLRGE